MHVFKNIFKVSAGLILFCILDVRIQTIQLEIWKTIIKGNTKELSKVTDFVSFYLLNERSHLSELLLIGPFSMVLSPQVAVWSVGRHDGNAGLLFDTGTDLQQLGVGVELTVGQQEDALSWSQGVVARRQAFLCQVIIIVFFHVAFKVPLVPFSFSEHAFWKLKKVLKNVYFIKKNKIHLATYICSSSSEPIMSL